MIGACLEKGNGESKDLSKWRIIVVRGHNNIKVGMYELIQGRGNSWVECSSSSISMAEY